MNLFFIATPVIQVPVSFGRLTYYGVYANISYMTEQAISPNIDPSKEIDALRRDGLQTLLEEMGNPEATFIDGSTPIVDYYMNSVKDPSSMVNSFPYSQETGIPEGGVNEMKYGDVMKVQILGKDFLKPEHERLAITVGFYAAALLRDPNPQNYLEHLDSWIARWKD